MTRRFLRWPWLVLYSLLTLLYAAWYVPRISAARYREPIQRALEDALGRKVEIGEVRFRLLPVPGFTVANVNIGEDPAIGAEPAAYVTTLRARPRLSALLGGPLEFASVDLEDASLNLTRVDRDAAAIRWNFSSLMRLRPRAGFPSVHLIGGRINFKLGQTKSVFYLLNTDVDLWPPTSSGAPWTLRVHAEPARTDRPARGFGSFAARGEWRQSQSAVTLDVKLEKSELGDLVTLFEGAEPAVHGHIWGDAHLAGPLNRVGLSGRVMIDDIHGWNQTPPGGSAWPLAVGGWFDVPGRTAEVQMTTQGRDSPVDLRYHVADYLGRPRWGVTAIFSRLPLAPLVGIARNLGWKIPADFTFDGVAGGSVDYGSPDGVPKMDGEIRVSDAKLGIAGAPPLKIADAVVHFAGSSISLPATAVINDRDETARIVAAYDTVSRRFDAELSTDGMAIASLRRQISVAGAPLLSDAIDGTWSGSLRYSNAWTGDIFLRDTDIPFEAFAEPLHIVSAEATIEGAAVTMKRLNVTAAGMEAQGEYRYDPAAGRPHRFRLTVPRANGAAMERLLTPALHRGSFLTYAFNFGRVPEPDWMRNIAADGVLQIGALDLGGTIFSKLRSRVIWDGDVVRFSGLQGQAQAGSFNGAASVNLSQRAPRYELNGALSHFAWRAGTVGAEGTVTTFGTGLDLLANLHAAGSLHARNTDLAPLEAWDSIDGCFDWTAATRNPKLRLTQLVMTAPGETWLGGAETQDNGQLLLRVSDGAKQLQASGALLKGEPLRLIP